MTTPVAPPPADDRERRLHPWSWLFVLLQHLKHYLIPLILLLVLNRGDRYEWWSLVVVGVLVLFAVMQYFTYRYSIGTDGLTVRSGWLQRSRREIPYARIHNVVVQQSLLHRVFGVAEVKLESAGGNKPEAHMRVLRMDEALCLEDLVRHRGQVPAVAGHPDAGALSGAAHAGGDGVASALAARGGRAPANEDTPVRLLSMPVTEVLRLGLVSNRGTIVVTALIAGLFKLFPERSVSHWLERHGREVAGYASQYHGGWILTTTLAITLVGCLVAGVRLLSVALAVTHYYGFELRESRRRVTVERGLLSRVRTSVARRRIQAWTLQEGLLHRLLRRRTLRIDTAVAESQHGESHKSLKELAPIATPAACDALVQQLLPGVEWPRAHWQPLPALAWLRLFLPRVVAALALAAGLAWYFGAWGWLALGFIPLAAYESQQLTRRTAYSVDERLVAVRGGWWARYWRFAEIDKLQAVQLVRNPMDQALGTATLYLDTAGASHSAPPLRLRFIPEADARALHARLAHAVAQRRLLW